MYNIIAKITATCFMLLLSSYHAFAAAPQNWSFGLPEAVSPTAKMIESFHANWLMPIIVLTTILVLVLLIYVCVKFREKANPTPSKTTHNAPLEVIWTVVPVIILAVMFIPSMKLHYFAEEIPETTLTVKITGLQWYWNYTYPEHEDLSFDSYMIAEEDLTEEQKPYRLMLVDNALVLPVGENIRIQMTSADVLHNWSVSDFGVRMDAVPGRLNETWVRVDKEGTYFGFCSELCGANHAYMPITVQVVSKEEFKQWLVKAKQEFASNKPQQNNIIELARAN